MTQKAELVITALQQRIGEIVSNYETQIAILRAEITGLVQEKEAAIKEGIKKDEAVEAYSEHLDNLAAN